MKKSLSVALPVFLLILAYYTQALTGTTYYVSQTGSGTLCTQEAPCIWSAGQGKLQPGDTLQILGVLNQSVTFSKSGTASAPITLRGKINGPHDSQNALLVIASNVILDGLEVTGGKSFGIRVGTNITYPTNIKIRNFSVHDSVWENRSGDKCIGGTGGWGRGLTISMTASNVQIYNGSVYNNCGEGLAFTQTHNVYAYDLTIYDNFSRNVYIGNSYDIAMDRITSYCSNPNFYRDGKPARGFGLSIETTNYSIVGNQLHDVMIQNSTVKDCLGINYYSQVANQYPSYVWITNVCFTNVPLPQVNIPGTNIYIVPCNTVSPTPTKTLLPPTPTPTPVLCQPPSIPEFVQKSAGWYYYCIHPVP